MRPGAGFALSLMMLGALALGGDVPSSPTSKRPASGSTAIVRQGSVRDSADVVEAARRAQRRFERIRSQHLPTTFSRSRGRCDEVIGRFCFWHDEDASRHPPAEHASVGAGREHLIAQLDSAAQIVPGDGWIAGQRVRYLIEAGRNAQALVAATHDCAADPWWCWALTGLVRHESMRYDDAEAAFDRALALMSDERRCEWTDIELLLDHDLRGDYRKLDCADRAPLEAEFWWLADPLLLVPGNERRSEHFARLTLNELLRASSTPRQSRWRDDNRELLIRYGPTIWWERERPPVASMATSGSVIGHERHGGRQFAPPTAFMRDPSSIRSGTWVLDPDRPHTSHAPRYATEFENLEHQLAVFPQGDSALLVAVVESTGWMRPDSGAGDSAVAVGIGWSPNPDRSPRVTRTTAGEVPVLAVPLDAGLVSVEAMSPADSLAARDRYWLDLTERTRSGFWVSDVLVTRATEQAPRTLDEALSAVVRSPTLEPGQDVGFYWELHGIGPGPTPLDVSLSVEQVGKSFIRKAAEWAGLVGSRDAGVAMRWQEAGDPAVGNTRAIVVRLNDDMQGTYLVTLRVRRRDGGEAASSRRLVIRP